MRAIVLGSGLNKFSEYFENLKKTSFRSELDLTFEYLEGHDRKYIWCTFEGETFLVIAGKLHYYEGHGFLHMIAPIQYAIEVLGVKEVMVTSASGGLSGLVEVGVWTHVKHVISIPETNLEIPSNLKTKNKTTSSSLIDDALISLPQVSYAYHQGPSLGTVAEYKMLCLLGVDLVGMSMFPECCYLKSINIKSHFLSIPVCNYFPFDHVVEPSYEEVLNVSASSIPSLVEIWKNILSPKNT